MVIWNVDISLWIEAGDAAGLFSTDAVAGERKQATGEGDGQDPGGASSEEEERERKEKEEGRKDVKAALGQ